MLHQSDPCERGCTKWMAIMVFVSFGIVLFVTRQHPIPLGLHMILGLGDPWCWEVVTGSLGAVCLIGAMASARPWLVHRWTLVGAVLLLGSWIVLAARSDNPLVTIVTSVPFLVFLGVLSLHAAGSEHDLLAEDQRSDRARG